MVLSGIRTFLASSGLGILINGMSCSGGSDSKPGSWWWTHSHALWCCHHFHLLAAFSVLGGHSSCLGGYAAAASSSWGLLRSTVSSSGVGETSCWSCTGSSSMASRMSSPWTASDWSCTHKDLWQHCTLHHMVHWTIGHNSVELWLGPGFSPSLFPRYIRSPWGFQMAGICHDVGHRGWEEDPTNPFLWIELQEVRNLWPISWPVAVQPLSSTPGSESEIPATSQVVASSPWCMPWLTPWAIWLGLALWSVWASSS